MGIQQIFAMWMKELAGSPAPSEQTEAKMTDMGLLPWGGFWPGIKQNASGFLIYGQYVLCSTLFQKIGQWSKKYKWLTISSLEIITVGTLVCILLDIIVFEKEKHVRKITLITSIVEFLFLTKLCMLMFIKSNSLVGTTMFPSPPPYLEVPTFKSLSILHNMFIMLFLDIFFSNCRCYPLASHWRMRL